MSPPRPFAAILYIITILAACGHETASAAADTADDRADGPGLTVEYARWRKQQIVDVDYTLSVSVGKSGESFSGVVVANTTLAKPLTRPLTIDFTGGEVIEVSVDGEEIPFGYNGFFISLAPGHLNPGNTEITIRYRQPYSTDGSGLHRFEDPEDGNVYLYTHFEPYKANRFFPHFDQPDLKARYTVDVIAPADWQVVTTAREEKIEQAGAGFRHWRFPQTEKISSYIFPLHAGPYVVWENEADGIPLRLMARKTLAPNVKPEDWFAFTRQSFDFFQDYFGIDYPFAKYDQLIVPDFTIGAMENVAAVTFNEDAYVSRGDKTQAERQRLATVIAHEMAHMWFGNLVTMRWWNGLWLKESFATYMGYLALAGNSEFDDVWENFYLRAKRSAYAADELVTTHSIELPVENTAEAFSNFDGITYGKGGSVLKQLPHLLGADVFRQGVSNYLGRYAYGNATLRDFMASLGEAADQDLDQWTRDWLYQPGVNTIKASYQCDDDSITSLVIEQTAPEEYPVLRRQRVQLGIYRMQDAVAGPEMTRVATVPVTYRGARTEVDKAIGLPCPQILNPNDEDWAYVKVELDSRSVEQLALHINAIGSPFTRLMLWQNLFDGVLAAKMPLSEWIGFALNNAAAERDINVIRALSNHLQTANAYLHRVGLPAQERDDALHAIEQFVWNQLDGAAAGSDAQKTWFNAFTEVARTGDAMDFATGLLLGDAKIAGLSIDQDRRWQLIVLLNRHLYGDYEELIANELLRDKSERARNFAISAEAARPQAEVKREWLDNIVARRDRYKLSQIKAATGALFPPEQLALYQAASARLFGAVPTVSATGDTLHNKAYAMLFPVVCSKPDISIYSRTLDQHPELMPALERVLKNRRQQSQRCAAMAQLQKKNNSTG